jgi:nitroimidazol reductase NimA-like FMN-containing flavoprotein (pyridoxamine 5'-phosphate oxidase superfamily)
VAILPGYDCWELLASEEVARVAWAGPDGVAIVPVNYVVGDGALWFRTQPYTALGRQCGGGRVAVEVDHLDRETRSAWSVVVVGTAEPVDGREVPDGLLDIQVWPADVRNLYVRIEPVEVTGRRVSGRRTALT